MQRSVYTSLFWLDKVDFFISLDAVTLHDFDSILPYKDFHIYIHLAMVLVCHFLMFIINN